MRSGLEFSVRFGKMTVQVEGLTHESALVKYLMARRRSLLGMKDKARARELFSKLPRKVTVSGGGSSKSYRIKREEVGKRRFRGGRFVFTVEESGLGRLLGALRAHR